MMFQVLKHQWILFWNLIFFYRVLSFHWRFSWKWRIKPGHASLKSFFTFFEKFGRIVGLYPHLGMDKLAGGPTSNSPACIVTRSCEGVQGFDSPPKHIGFPIYHDTQNNNNNNILASYDEVYYSWHNTWTQKLLLEVISSYRAAS